MRNGNRAAELAAKPVAELTERDIHVLQGIAYAAVACRHAQVTYFKFRNTANLEAAKQLERALDELLDSKPVAEPKQHGLF